MILASAVLSQYTRVTDGRHLTGIAELAMQLQRSANKSRNQHYEQNSFNIAKDEKTTDYFVAICHDKCRRHSSKVERPSTVKKLSKAVALVYHIHIILRVLSTSFSPTAH